MKLFKTIIGKTYILLIKRSLFDKQKHKGEDQGTSTKLIYHGW